MNSLLTNKMVMGLAAASLALLGGTETLQAGDAWNHGGQGMTCGTRGTTYVGREITPYYGHPRVFDMTPFPGHPPVFNVQPPAHRPPMTFQPYTSYRPSCGSFGLSRAWSSSGFSITIVISN
jgi:hypothetical protein